MKAKMSEHDLNCLLAQYWAEHCAFCRPDQRRTKQEKIQYFAKYRKNLLKFIDLTN